MSTSDQQIHTEKLFGADDSDGDSEPDEENEPAGGIRQYIPNALTFLRLGLAVAFPFLPRSLRLAALVVAALTEWLDGALSRLWNAETQLGRMLDPVADKLFVLVMFATFIWEGRIAAELVGLVLLRDITVAVACIGILLFGNRENLKRLRPRILGKIATAFQFALLLVLLIWKDDPIWLVGVTAALSGAAAVDYVQYYFRSVRKQDSPSNH